jgi:hypothetical protein
MINQSVHWAAVGRRNFLDALRSFDQPKQTRFLAIVIAITPLVFLTRWIAGIHGTFMYDDLDILAVVRTMPLVQSLWLVHGDVPIPLFRVFFASMYALFGVNELYWNLYFLLLILAVNLTALAILVSVGANLIVSTLFYLTTMSAAVWNYNPTVGYYSMSIYPQIGLLGLVGVLAIIRWRSTVAVFYKWLALAASVIAPFIHPSGAYVPMAVGAFTYFNELARSGASWSPLRMFAPDFRWLTIGLAAGLLLFAAYFVDVVHDGPFLSMAHSPLSVIAVVKSAYFLFSQGVALELYRPLIFPLRRADLVTQNVAAVAIAFGFAIAGFLNVTATQRRTYLALLTPSIIVIIVVSLGRRLTGIDDVVNSVGKYNTYAYLWFSLANFYLLSCLVAKIPVRWREISAALAVLIAAVLFVQYTRQDNTFRTEAIRRGQQMDHLVAVFRNYAAKAAPAPVHIPTLDGNFIYPTHAVLLYKYNLAHYRPFFQGFDDRLTLLRNTAMDNWGREGTQTVRSLREATDPAFIRALETDPDLQSLYLDSVELEPRKTRPDDEPMRLDEFAIKNANVVRHTANAVSFTTTGGASAMLLAGDRDPEQIHILSMNVSAVLDKPVPGEEPQVEVLFEGQLPIPYRPNRIAVPKDGGVISVDLLQLYSYSLNPQVGKLSLRFPSAGSYTITDLRLAR